MSSMYKFVRGEGGRLFVEGGDGADCDLEKVHTKRHLATSLVSSRQEDRRAQRSGGTRTVTTRLLSRTTTISRGEEKSVSERMTRHASIGSVYHHPGKTEKLLALQSNKRKVLSLNYGYFFYCALLLLAAVVIAAAVQ